MDEIIFEWDPVKADLNYTKHKVTFDEAKSVFYDENAILIADPDHSSMDEDRFIMLGLSSELHMLVVCHCYRKMTEFVSFRPEKLIRLKPHNMEDDNMRDHYDFSNGIKNPYADKLKKQITIRLDDTVIDYFKNMAEETGMPYQNIINYYLLDCVKEKKHLELAFSK